MLVIVYYLNSKTGGSPVKEDIKKLNKPIKSKIRAFIMYVAEKQGKAESIISKNIRGYHFSEVRIKVSKNLYRALYCVWQDEYMVILHIFNKKEGERTSQKELNVGESRYVDFKNNPTFYIK